jgi:hypothetical protein
MGDFLTIPDRKSADGCGLASTPAIIFCNLFSNTSGIRRGIVVAAKIKQGFKLGLMAVRKHRPDWAE